MDNFLKRFEKLENIPKENLIKEGLTISKRFEYLEIGDRRIEIAIHDKITQDETAPPEIKYFIFCPYCGKENESDAEFCVYCQHSLRTLVAKEYQKQLLKRCVCGAVNQRDRKNCWACGRDFSLWGDADVKTTSENVIKLNIDGVIYSSTDKYLPSGIVVLMERIRKEGYKKEIIDEWIKERNMEASQKEKEHSSRLTQVEYGLFWRIFGLILFLLFVIFQLRLCIRF